MKDKELINLDQIDIQGNATCKWFQKHPDFNDSKMILLRSVSFGLAAGLFFSPLLVEATIIPNINEIPYFILSFIAILVSLYAHLRMLFSGQTERIILTNIQSYFVNVGENQLYLHSDSGDIPLFDDVGFVYHQIDFKDCQITFGGYANGSLLRSLVEAHSGQTLRTSQLLDFSVSIATTRNSIETLQSALSK